MKVILKNTTLQFISRKPYIDSTDGFTFGTHERSQILKNAIKDAYLEIVDGSIDKTKSIGINYASNSESLLSFQVSQFGSPTWGNRMLFSCSFSSGIPYSGVKEIVLLGSNEYAGKANIHLKVDFSTEGLFGQSLNFGFAQDSPEQAVQIDLSMMKVR